jgi:hypothetical protein
MDRKGSNPGDVAAVGEHLKHTEVTGCTARHYGHFLGMKVRSWSVTYTD